MLKLSQSSQHKPVAVEGLYLNKYCDLFPDINKDEVCKINSVQYEFINSLFILTMYMPIITSITNAVGHAQCSDERPKDNIGLHLFQLS